MRRLTPLFALLILPLAAVAAPVGFGNGWKEQKFALFSSNDYSLGGSTLGVSSDGTVSLLWTALDRSFWGARSASWRWAVDESVPATDLRKKGGDDRNLSLYFVFLPDTEAEAAQGSSIRRLLEADNARVLVYVWGGPSGQSRIQKSPYLGPRGKTIALRPAGEGQASEKINLAADFRTAFGSEPSALVGLAVSADSDDTDTRIRARISDLSLR